MDDAGRWALVRRANGRGDARPQAKAAATEHVARALLRRYGMVLGACWGARPSCCRRGAICCASIAAWRRAVETTHGCFVAGFW